MRPSLAVGVASVLLVLGGCTAGQPEPSSSPAQLIVPGRPGEQARTVTPEEAAEQRQDVPANDADADYMRMMIPHHEQAITMTDLVADRTRSESVRKIAGRIAVTQSAEITAMTDWLRGHGEQLGEHHHGLMPGMATPEQLDALRAARGAEFDRQFLTLMIRHHEGALTMAEDYLPHGVEPRALAMAQDVITSQNAEIQHMRAMLD